MKNSSRKVHISAVNAGHRYIGLKVNLNQDAAGQALMMKLKVQLKEKRMRMDSERKLSAPIVRDTWGMYSLENGLLPRTPGTA